MVDLQKGVLDARATLKQSLLCYCELDTLATGMLAERLRELGANQQPLT